MATNETVLTGDDRIMAVVALWLAPFGGPHWAKALAARDKDNRFQRELIRQCSAEESSGIITLTRGNWDEFWSIQPVSLRKRFRQVVVPQLGRLLPEQGVQG